MTPLPTLDDFAPLQGECFELHADGPAPLQARLVAALALGMAPVSGRQPFSLTFAGPNEPRLPQRIYRLQHPQLPVLDLFLVPVGADAAATRYEAVFT